MFSLLNDKFCARGLLANILWWVLMVVQCLGITLCPKMELAERFNELCNFVTQVIYSACIISFALPETVLLVEYVIFVHVVSFL